MKYPKINSIFKRDEKTHKFTKEYSEPEFDYLKNNTWLFTEKIDGTNTRVYWNHEDRTVRFEGRKDNSQIPPYLMDILLQLFTWQKFAKAFSETSMILYGEGYGYKIQKKMGMKYSPNKCKFMLFDIRIGEYWLEMPNIKDIANYFGIETVPEIGGGTLDNAITMCKRGFHSKLGSFEAEGIVLKPFIQLFNRKGERIITKVKLKDYR